MGRHILYGDTIQAVVSETQQHAQLPALFSQVNARLRRQAVERLADQIFPPQVVAGDEILEAALIKLIDSFGRNRDIGLLRELVQTGIFDLGLENLSPFVEPQRRLVKKSETRRVQFDRAIRQYSDQR